MISLYTSMENRYEFDVKWYNMYRNVWSVCHNKVLAALVNDKSTLYVSTWLLELIHLGIHSVF